jgi:5'-AMP-activated protein kinase catalytic alpha subunit
MVSGAKYVPLMTDIWSSGIILYAMLAGYLPFEDANYKVLYSKVLKGKYKTPEWISEDAKHLLSGIINVNPK